MLLKPKAPCFPKKGKECERCPKSTPRAEISSFNVLLNQHLQLNHHLCYRIDKAATQLLGAKVRAGPELDAT